MLEIRNTKATLANRARDLSEAEHSAVIRAKLALCADIGPSGIDLLGNNDATLTTTDVEPATTTATERGVVFDCTQSLRQYLVIPPNPSLNFTTAMSVSCWVKFKSLTGSQRLIAKWDGSDTWILEKASDGQYKFWIDTTSVQNAATTVGVEVGAWHHVCGTYGDGNIRLYIDGIERGTLPKTGAISTNNADILIGASEGLTVNPAFFDGQIDLILIHDYVLPPGEINEIVSASSGRFSDGFLSKPMPLPYEPPVVAPPVGNRRRRFLIGAAG